MKIAPRGSAGDQHRSSRQVQDIDQVGRGGEEAVPLVRRDGSGVRKRHGLRILVNAANAVFVVQVRTGREPGLADIANDLAQLDPLAAAHLRREARQVAVDGDHARAVFELDDIAVAALAPDEADPAFAGGAHRRADRRGVVDATVCANGVEHRVAARRIEARADARELHGCADERLAQAPAVGREVFAVALLVDVAHGAVFTAFVDELRGQDVSGTQRARRPGTLPRRPR